MTHYRHQVVVVGGGAAGIACAASMLRRRPKLDIAIVDGAKDHFYQPGWTMVGGGIFEVPVTRRPMASVIPRGAHWIRQNVASFDPAANMLTTSDGDQVSYDLLVVAPDAPAVLATDRMLIRPTPQTVAYLPDARWSDDVPRLLQSLLVQTLCGTGRIGYVGTPGSGPVPDVALLLRLDRFEVEAGQTLRAVLSFQATLLRDRDQRVIASRRFAGNTVLANDNAATVAAGFQALIGETLPATADWVLGQLAS